MSEVVRRVSFPHDSVGCFWAPDNEHFYQLVEIRQGERERVVDECRYCGVLFS